MTEKKKFTKKLLDGVKYFFNPNNSPIVNDIKAEYANAPKGYFKEKIKKTAKEHLLMYAIIYGVVIGHFAVGQLAYVIKNAIEKKNDVKIEKKETRDKNLEKPKLKDFKNQDLNAQDSVLEHNFYPQKKKEEEISLIEKRYRFLKERYFFID